MDIYQKETEPNIIINYHKIFNFYNNILKMLVLMLVQVKVLDQMNISYNNLVNK